MTLASPMVGPVRRASVYAKKSCTACQLYPTCRGETTRPPELSRPPETARVHSYKLYSSSHPSHVKNSISFSQFLRLRRLCSDDSDFFHKSESMCQFFEKRGYPASIVQAGLHRAQLIDRQSSLQASQKQHSDRIPLTLTFHPHNHSVKSIILKNFKLLQNDPETGTIFSQPPLISFKRDKNVGNFHSKLMTNPKLLNALAHDAKLVLSFTTPTKYRDPSDQLRSLIASRAPPPTSSIA